MFFPLQLASSSPYLSPEGSALKSNCLFYPIFTMVVRLSGLKYEDNLSYFLFYRLFSEAKLIDISNKLHDNNIFI